MRTICGAVVLAGVLALAGVCPAVERQANILLIMADRKQLDLSPFLLTAYHAERVLKQKQPQSSVSVTTIGVPRVRLAKMQSTGDTLIIL